MKATGWFRPAWRGAVLLGSALGLALATAAQAEEPMLADVGVYSEVIANKKDREILDNAGEMQELFYRRGMLVNEPELERYLSDIGYRLLPEPTDDYIDYRFAVLRDPLPNAFALPDGQIYVHSGLLAWMENEAQLAGMLAHEINHVAGHHTILHQRAIRKKAIAAAVVGGVLTVGLGEDGAGLAAMINQGIGLSVYSHSRNLETEADLVAAERLAKAGYDIGAFAETFLILKQDFDGLQLGAPAAYMTHPLLELRYATLKTVANGMSGGKADTTTFHRVVHDLAFDTVDDYLDIDMPRTGLALAQQLLERYGETAAGHTAIAESYVALGARSAYSQQNASQSSKRRNNYRRVALTRRERLEQALNAPAGLIRMENNLRDAIEHYEAATGIDDTYPPALRGMGDACLLLGRYRQAAKAYRDYLKLAPDAPDKQQVLQRAAKTIKALKNS